MFCDIVLPDGTPSYADPRQVLKRTLAKASDLGFAFYTHPEIEFFLFRDQPGPGQPPEPVDQGGYFDHIAARHRPRLPPRRDHDARVDGHLGGVQPPRGRAGPAGDRPAVRRRALDRRQHHDVPARDEAGRARARASTRRSCPSRSPTTRAPGMHTHLSLFEGERNAFFEAGAQYQLSKVARSFIAGLLRHAGEITAVTNQWVNSYKRLLGGGEAPAYVCWGHNNRSAHGAGADVQAGQGPVDPGRAAHAGLGVQPLPRLRGDPRPPASRASRRATSCRRAPRTTCGR